MGSIFNSLTIVLDEPSIIRQTHNKFNKKIDRYTSLNYLIYLFYILSQVYPFPEYPLVCNTAKFKCCDILSYVMGPLIFNMEMNLFIHLKIQDNLQGFNATQCDVHTIQKLHGSMVSSN